MAVFDRRARHIAGALVLALISAPSIASAQDAAKPAKPPVSAADKRNIDEAKQWNANPAGSNPRDFQGIWWLRRTYRGFAPVTESPVADGAAIEFVPMSPMQAALRQHRIDMEKAGTPLAVASADCRPHGVPRIALSGGYPFEIDMGPQIMTFLIEVNHDMRIIHMDGKPAPADEPATYMGYSRGRWDGATLIVDTDHLNGKTSLDEEGLSHGPKLKVHEEFTKYKNKYGGVDLRDLITVDDPDYFTRPWQTEKTFSWRGDVGITEYTCEENNRNQSENGVTVAR